MAPNKDYSELNKIECSAMKDAFDLGFEQGYQKGFCMRSVLDQLKEDASVDLTNEESVYLRGVYDAWECASELIEMKPKQIREIFGCEDDTFLFFKEKFLPTVAIQKLREYKLQQLNKELL